jgi:hypothetical protein
VLGALLLPHMGAHLYRTHEGGWYFSAVTTDGFADPSDPYGGIFDYGIRTIAATPYGLFLGTTNDYHGLAIFRGTRRRPLAPDPPHRVEIEPTKNGSALLSWKASSAAKRYHIWRAERNPILIRDDIDVEDFNSTTGNKIPDVYVGLYQQIGVSKDTIFVDSTVQSGQPYMYYVLVEAQDGKASDESNLVAFPLLTPSVTFAQLLDEVGVLDQRQRFKNPVTQLTQVRKMIVDAQRLAMNCQIRATINELDPQKAYSEVVQPDAIDLEILIAKLVRRLQLFNRLPNEVISNEFCNQP